jgi:hypothetical protein
MRGFACHQLCSRRGALLPHLFTLTRRSARSARRRAVSFLCHFPSSHPDRTLSGALPCGVRTFLPVPSAPRNRLRTRRSSGLLRTSHLTLCRTFRQAQNKRVCGASVPYVLLAPSPHTENAGGPSAAFARTQVIRAVMVPVAIGLLATLNSRDVHSRRIILAWIGSCIVLLAYAYVWQAFLARGVVLPSVVPGFHFAGLLESGEAVLFGVGVASAVQFASNAWTRGRMRFEPIVLCLLLIASATAVWPRWVRRPDFTSARIESLGMYLGPDFTGMFRWIRSSSQPDDVFLAPENLSLSVIGAAGRKVVVGQPLLREPVHRLGVPTS